MRRTDHLIYIDITNECLVSCENCMYRQEREKPVTQLTLNDNAALIIENLVNHSATDQIIISGEGEPFQNANTMERILRLSHGNNHFQILTSGSWPANKTLSRLAGLAQEMGDHYTLRLSVDPFHAAKIPHRHYVDIVGNIIMRPSEHFSLAVRSLLEQKQASRRIIESILRDIGVKYRCDQMGFLDDSYSVGEVMIPVTYKSGVFIDRIGGIACPIHRYIAALEEKYNRVFTLGNLKSRSKGTGLDLTVKMDGSVFFYGAEFASFGNIFSGNVCLDHLQCVVTQHPWLHKLYSTPFMTIVRELCEDTSVKQIVDHASNPYWIIRRVAEEYPQILAEVAGEDCDKDTTAYAEKQVGYCSGM